MSFTQNSFLLEKLENLISHNASHFSVFEIISGPLSFNVWIPNNSNFLKCIDAFYNVKPAHKINRKIFQLICIDGRWVDVISSLDLSPKKIVTYLQDAKNYTGKPIILPDTSRGIIRSFDPITKLGLFYINKSSELPSWEYFSPFKEFIHFLALQNECCLLHGACIGRLSNGTYGGHLLVGPGGSGKSTSTAALIIEGFFTTGDDYLLLEPSTLAVFSHAIYRTIKIHPSSPIAQRELPSLIFSRVDENTSKSISFLNDKQQSGPFTSSIQILEILEISLTNNHHSKNQPTETKFIHFVMSSIQQIPYWINHTLKISKIIYQQTTHKNYEIKKGSISLEGFIDALERQ